MKPTAVLKQKKTMCHLFRLGKKSRPPERGLVRQEEKKDYSGNGEKKKIYAR